MTNANVILIMIAGLYDYIYMKIPNGLLLIWLITYVFSIINNCTISITHILQNFIIAVLIVVSYFPLRRVVKVSGGDIKYYSTLVICMGYKTALSIIFISNIFSIIPIAFGVRRVPMAFMSVLAFATFYFFNLEGLL